MIRLHLIQLLSRCLLPLFLAWGSVITCFEFPYSEVIQAQFHQNFEEKCVKRYPHLIQQYINKLETPNDRYIMFVFEEGGLKNGGLGDRLAGLISAVAMALRFNRTLLIRDSSGLSQHFRPYHPTDIYEEEPRFLWDRYLSWSHYNPALSNHDETEYDLYYCINHGTSKTAACSMQGGDVSQPNILLRCNRVYFCHYEMATSTVAHDEWRNKLGIKPTDDLYELSGCFLRLALWPTREMWEEVDEKYYQELYSRLTHQNITDTPSFTHENRKNHHNIKKKTKRRSLRHSDKFGIQDEPDGSRDRSNKSRHHKHSHYNESSMRSHINDFYQIGIHFRCGDRSYMKVVHDYDCRYEVEHPSSNSYMLSGNPFELSMCTKELLRNHTLHLMQEHRSIVTDEQLELLAQAASNGGFTATSSSSQFVTFFTASDNELSSKQIEDVIHYSHTLVSPTGCHVEWDHSPLCLSLTLTYWFMLSMSRYLSVQIIDDTLPAPASSFSRYAGMYGLYNNPFRSGKHCTSDFIDTRNLSRIQHNNWFC